MTGQANNSRHDINFIAETTFGTTPGTPQMAVLPHTGSTLKLNKDNFVSNTIRPDRQIKDMRHGVKQVGGDINFELSYGQYDDWLAAALFGDWATNVLKAGTTSKFFTVERQFQDISEYLRFTGCMVNSLSLNIQPNAMVTGTLGIIGKDVAVASSALDSTPTAAVGNEVMDGFGGSMQEGGASSAIITSLDLQLNNGLQPSFVVGSDSTPCIQVGQSVLTGNVSMFFENETHYNKFVNETESSLQVVLDGIDGGDYTIDIPRIKYNAADNDVTNTTDGVLLSMPFQALRDDTEATNLKITRTPA